jgi:hypothetical protein
LESSQIECSPFFQGQLSTVLKSVRNNKEAHVSASQSAIVPINAELDAANEGLVNRFAGWWKAKYGRFIAAAALGSIPWVGGILSAAIALQAEGGLEKLNETQKLWLQELSTGFAALLSPPVLQAK